MYSDYLLFHCISIQDTVHYLTLRHIFALLHNTERRVTLPLSVQRFTGLQIVWELKRYINLPNRIDSIT